MLVQSIPYPQGGGGGGGHRYWRLNMTANQGHATATQFVEVEMRESPGGADATGSGTASGGGGFSGSTAGDAFDDDNTTAYTPSGTSGWLEYDFGLGNEKNIVEIAVKANGPSHATLTAGPKDFTLEWSDDDSNWTVAETCNLYGPLIDFYHVFPETPPASGFHRFWRVLCTSSNGGTFYLIDDIEFRATAAGADQVPVQSGANGDASGRAIMTVGDSNAFQAFGSDTNVWSSSGTTNRWVGFIFATAVKVEEIALKVGANTSRTPNTIQIEHSDDGVTWTNQKSIGSLTWSASETKVLTAI